MKYIIAAIAASTLFSGCFYSTMIVCPSGRRVYTSGMGFEKTLGCSDKLDDDAEPKKVKTTYDE